MMGSSEHVVQTKQAKVAAICPFGCEPVLVALQSAPGRNTYSRCHHCLAYWVTSPSGEVLVCRQPDSRDRCPRCGLFINSPLAEHICKKDD